MVLGIQAQEIKVVTEYLSPYQTKNPDGSLGGFSTEVVQALFKQANKEPLFIVLPWARAYEVAKSEKNVMIFSMARTKERDTLFHWVGSLTEVKLYFWGLKSKFPKTIDNIEHLKSYKIATARYSNADQYLMNNNFHNIYKLSNEDQNLQMLFTGRVDLITTTEKTLKSKSLKLGLDFEKLIKVKEFNELNNDLNLAFNLQSDPKIVKEFQQAYSVIKAKGIIKALKKKWSIPH
ncbi:MAG: transporter substrate-binding domain-containing protein [Thalassotalea sp.]|nr:transporter substrate-binding domain-containing protein [Thalassotalea sp.]